ncbi:MAG: SDR family oxidoreductase [Campylobacterota bacterium]|nr:SDR family NAD(P)-dependent oxidoreductase [Sulfuricurvum sp.]
MATAIVTGSSSGIGEACARMLLSEGYQVVGISRSPGAIRHPSFVHLPCDLGNFAAVEALKASLVHYEDVALLVNASGFGRFEPHEEIAPTVIRDMVALNLTAPMLLTHLVLRSLKRNRGTIVNITSIEATRHSKFSALYTATKAGLRSFGHSLFEELRSAGVGVLTLNPDMTDTPFFDTLRFGVGEGDDVKLFASDIAEALKNALSMREGVSITEITVRPRRFGMTKKNR